MWDNEASILEEGEWKLVRRDWYCEEVLSGNTINN